MNRADYAKAIGYYQRVYVAYQKYPELDGQGVHRERAAPSRSWARTRRPSTPTARWSATRKSPIRTEVDEAKKRLAEMGQS